MRPFLAILLLLLGLLCSLIAVSTIFWQHHALQSFIPVPVTILSSQVTAHRSRRSTSYSADITYRYTYKDQTYDASNVSPVDDSSSESWCRDVVKRYPAIPFSIPGLEGPPLKPNATAYINPDDPTESFLIHEHSVTPYFCAILALLATQIGLGLLLKRIAGARATMQAIALDDSGWQLLLPDKSVRARFLDALASFTGIFLTCSLLLSHWLAVADYQSFGAIFLIAAASIATLFFAIIAFRRWSITRHMSDARLRIKPVPMKLGELLSLQLEADAYAPLHVKVARARVVCIEHYKEKRGNKTSYGTRTRSEEVTELAASLEVPAGQVLAGAGEVQFDPNSAPPTSELPSKIYPYYTWEIRIQIELTSTVDYNARFPLEVT